MTDDDDDKNHVLPNKKLKRNDQQHPTKKEEWTMKPCEMSDWMERVSSQSLEVCRLRVYVRLLVHSLVHAGEHSVVGYNSY